MTIIVAVIVLGVLIIVHEFGHFIVAKSFNVGVLEFAIGFGKKLWRKRLGETAYSIGAIPLGGYVRMVGDDPENYRQGSVLAVEGADNDQTALDPVEEKLLRDKSRWFLEKGLIARACIVLAGPAFNIIFAVLLAVAAFYVFGKGVPLDEPVIGTLIPGQPAEKAGLQVGDRIRAVDGRDPVTWEEFARTIAGSGGREMTFAVERRDSASAQIQQFELKITGVPESAELKLLGPGRTDNPYKIGVVPEIRRESASLGEAVTGGVGQTWYITVVTFRGLWGMISGVISPRHIAGPIFIFKEAARSAKRGVDYLLDFVVFLSMSLAILNLLPIPILDGGHLMFFLLEALRGKPLSLQVQGIANQVGLAALLLLMAFAVGNDIVRLFG